MESTNKRRGNQDKMTEEIEGKSARESPQNALRETAKNRRLEILEKVVKKVGFRNARARTKSLATNYKVTEKTIYTDFKWIKKNVKPENREEIKITVRVTIDNALDKALEQFVNLPTIENSLKMINIAKGYREELEEWGEKEKVEEKLNITHNEPIKLIIEKADDETNKIQTDGKAGDSA